MRQPARRPQSQAWLFLRVRSGGGGGRDAAAGSSLRLARGARLVDGEWMTPGWVLARVARL